MTKFALGLTVAVAAAGCTVGGGDAPSPVPGAPSTGSTLGSMAAFQEFSGLRIPASAQKVVVSVTTDQTGQPAYRVKFTLPSGQLDQFSADGQLNRPLHVNTIPASIREVFDFQGDSSTGVAIAEGSLPSNVRIQRQVLAVGISKPTADVQVYAYKMGS